MPRFELASEAHIRAIYRESHAFWGAGLSLEEYRELWDAVRRAPWATQHARFHVRVDDGGRVLSSLKRYRPEVRVLGRTSRATVLGAIFTPRSCRRQGHARALVEAMLRIAKRDGDLVALLFTDIGTDFYESIGFRALPAAEEWGSLPRYGPKGSWSLRPAEERDLELIQRSHADSMAGRGFEILRDDAHWEFLRVRTNAYFERTEDRGIIPRAWVAARDGQSVGFVSAVEGRGEWNLREFGALGGDPQLLADVLTSGALHARRRGLRRFYGWVPADVLVRIGGWRLKSAPRRRAVPMILLLDPALDVNALIESPTVYVPYQDQF
jgi:GNAT superfamily N-acetyltransferase